MKQTRNTAVTFQPIGQIYSPHTELKKTPVQPVFSKGIKGTVEIFPEYTEGLLDLEKFSHLFLFFYFHKSNKTKLIIHPYLEDKDHGIFATRAPHRPNKLGMSLVQLTKIEDNILHIDDVDVLNGTPLLDIKPFIKRFDVRDKVKSGWHDHISDETAAIRGKRQHSE